MLSLLRHHKVGVRWMKSGVVSGQNNFNEFRKGRTFHLFYIKWRRDSTLGSWFENETFFVQWSQRVERSGHRRFKIKCIYGDPPIIEVYTSTYFPTLILGVRGRGRTNVSSSRWDLLCSGLLVPDGEGGFYWLSYSYGAVFFTQMWGSSPHPYVSKTGLSSVL